MRQQINQLLVASLSSKHGGQRDEAVAVLERLGDDAIEPLVDLLRVESRKRKKRLVIYGTVMFLWVAAMLTMALTGHSHNIASFSGLTGGLASLAAFSQAQKNAASWLSRFDDVRTVGPLLQALEFQDKGIRQVAVERLVVLLPRLQASHANLLNVDDRAALRQVLRHGLYAKETPLVIAALQAIRQVGDEKMLPLVEKLVDMHVSKTGQDRVRDAAIETLPYLRELVGRQHEAQTLLRAATDPGNPAETLVRPAQGAPTMDPSLLVRPVGGPQGEELPSVDGRS